MPTLSSSLRPYPFPGQGLLLLAGEGVLHIDDPLIGKRRE